MILSLSTKFFVDVVGEIEGEKMGINYGFNKLRFVNPVKSNDMIRGVFKLKEVTSLFSVDHHGNKKQMCMPSEFFLSLYIQDKI